MISSSSKRAAENGSTTSVCRSDDASSDGDGSPSDVVHPKNKKRSPARSGLLFFRKVRSEEHTSELQSRGHLVCRLLLEKKKEQDKAVQNTTAHPMNLDQATH